MQYVYDKRRERESELKEGKRENELHFPLDQFVIFTCAMLPLSFSSNAIRLHLLAPFVCHVVIPTAAAAASSENALLKF